MTLLLTHYTTSEILLFIVILAIAFKDIVLFIDWTKRRTTQAVKESEQPIELKLIAKHHELELANIKSLLDSLEESINFLILSDRDDIKQSLTQCHHYFCYKLKSIDDYSLDCMERRYSHYKDEGGNSFVGTLMEEVRSLPRKIEIENR